MAHMVRHASGIPFLCFREEGEKREKKEYGNACQRLTKQQREVETEGKRDA